MYVAATQSPQAMTGHKSTADMPKFLLPLLIRSMFPLPSTNTSAGQGPLLVGGKIIERSESSVALTSVGGYSFPLAFTTYMEVLRGAPKLQK